MCFINNKPRQKLPLIQILQSRNQPVTCTDLGQKLIRHLKIFKHHITAKILLSLSSTTT